MTDNKHKEMKEHCLTALDLFVEVLVGSMLFLAVAAVAVGVEIALQWGITTFGVDGSLAQPLKILKYIIFLFDIALYILFLISVFREAWKRLWK